VTVGKADRNGCFPVLRATTTAAIIQLPRLVPLLRNPSPRVRPARGAKVLRPLRIDIINLVVQGIPVAHEVQAILAERVWEMQIFDNSRGIAGMCIVAPRRGDLLL